MKEPYVRFGLTLLLSLALMYVLSMSQIRSLDHFHLNLSNLWMALLMVSVMALVMMLAMPSMFKDRRLNLGLIAGFAVAAALAFYAARTQSFVGDRQFLESMIPHHSRAILVCQEAELSDQEIVDLCRQIIESQTAEIEQMNRILERR
jgi:uncharacterized protein (DUF305 family)